MSQEDEFIYVKDIDVERECKTSFDEREVEEGKPVYQVQPKTGTNKVLLMEVGRTQSDFSVLSGDFKVSDGLVCRITSKLYSVESLKSCNMKRFNIKKLIITEVKTGKSLGNINLDFVNEEDSGGLEDILSTRDELKEIKGHFLIYYTNGKLEKCFEKVEQYEEDIKMLEKILYYLVREIN